MSKFVHTDFSTTHPGVERFESALTYLKTHRLSFNGSRALAVMLTTALVATLLVVANQVIDTITDGHLFAAWIGLWAVGFAAMALLLDPLLALTATLREAWGDWREARRLAAQDEKLWELALQDARVMADIRSAASFSN
jgi:hypothetical protein